MIQNKKIIALLMAATTSVVMSSEFESQAADPALDMAQVKILGEYKLTQPYGFNDAPEEALLNLKKATAQAEEQYQEMKRKEKEARERKAAEEARKAQEEAERIAAQQAAAEQAAAEQAAAQQAAAEQAAVQQAAAEQQTAVQQTAAYSASASDQTLLAAIIFCEAGNQPYEGQVAVGAVVMNRVRSGAYPGSIQAVISAPGQFGPVATGRVAAIMAAGPRASCVQAAQAALNGETTVGTLTHFRRAGGIDGLVIGNHVFY